MILKCTCPERQVEINIGDLVTPKPSYSVLEIEEKPYKVLRFTETFPGNWCVVFKADGIERIFHPDNLAKIEPAPPEIPRPLFTCLQRKQIVLGEENG